MINSAYRCTGRLLILGAVSALLVTSVAGAQETSGLPDVEAALDRQAYHSALELVRPLVEEGNPDATSMLAHMFRRGLGLPQNYTRAYELDRIAARAGVVRSQNALGHALLAGFGAEQDIESALYWFEQAALSGDPDFQFDYAATLAGLPQPDFEAAARWYSLAAEQGNAEAQANLGVLYLQGDGVEANEAEAARLFRAAAESGNAQAQNNLGLLRVRGIGVEQDYEAAAHWFGLAVDQGLAEAMRNLSILHESGFGMPVDEEAARALLGRARAVEVGNVASLIEQLGVPFDDRLVMPDWSLPMDPAENAAAEAGETVALYRTAFRYLDGLGVRQDTRLGLARLQQAARQGSGAAALNLCVLYARGSRVPQSYRTALVWCSIASYRGQARAELLRDRLILTLPPDVVAAAQSQVPDLLAANDGGNRP